MKMEKEKKLSEEQLKDIDAGLAFKELKSDLLAALPLQIKQKLARAKSDNEACKILADSGINYEAIEKKMKEVFARKGKDLLALNDKQLEAIAGGFEDEDYGTIMCFNCYTDKRDDLSYQFWASTFLTSGRIYRCKKCGLYNKILKNRHITVMTETDYDNWLKDNLIGF